MQYNSYEITNTVPGFQPFVTGVAVE
jgi:hypothetical protein